MRNKLKALTIIALIALGTCTALQAERKVVVTQTTTRYEYATSNPFGCFGRGIFNVATCWTELPRCMLYDNAQVPVFGLIYGTVEGAGFTVWRALAGVYDIVSLGFSDEGFYGARFPEFFWESNWMPPSAESSTVTTTRTETIKQKVTDTDGGQKISTTTVEPKKK